MDIAKAIPPEEIASANHIMNLLALKFGHLVLV